MANRDSTQLNVRSRFARDRAAELAYETGMTTTQIVEEALRAYTPPPALEPGGGLVREGPILVLSSGGRTITHEQVDAAIEADRAERGECL